MNYLDQIKEIEANNTNPDDLSYGGFLEMPITAILEDNKDSQLRPAQKSTQGYKDMLASMQRDGQNTPINIRKSVRGGQFVIWDGVQRTNIAKDLGWTSIKCIYNPNIKNEQDILRLQIIANQHRIENRPADVRRQIFRITTYNPELRISDIAEMLSMNDGDVSKILKTRTVTSEVEEAINNDALTLYAAYHIAKLPPEHQNEFLDRAQNMKMVDFASEVTGFLKKLKENPSGAPVDPNEFHPRSKLRTVVEIEAQIANATPDVQSVLKWVLHLDDESIKEQKAQHSQRLREREERKLQREKAKQAKQAVVVEKVKEVKVAAHPL